MLKKQSSPARLNLLPNIVVVVGVPESVHVLVIQWVLLSMTFISIQSRHARFQLLPNIVVAEGVQESVHVLVIQWVLLSMTFISIQSRHARLQLLPISAAAAAEIVLPIARIRRLMVLLRMSRLSQPVRLRQVNASVAVAALLTANARNAKPTRITEKKNTPRLHTPLTASSDLVIDSSAGL